MARGEPAVHFRAARSFNRERPERIEATREWWGNHRREKTGYLVMLPFTNSLIQLKHLNLDEPQSNEKDAKLPDGAYHLNVGYPGSMLRTGSWVESKGWSVDLTTALSHSHLLPAVDSLGISDELKDKLEDVLIPEQQFTLGRMLGKGVGALWGLA